MKLGLDPDRPRSLRGQLIGLVAALVVPLVALQLWWGYRESQRAMETAAAEALVLADATASSVRQFLTQSEEMLTATSAQYRERFGVGPACERLMPILNNVFTFLTNLTSIDRDGNVTCADQPIPQGTSALSWSWFDSMAEDPRFIIGNPLFGTISGEWILPLVVPILDAQGQFDGALVGSVPLLEFDQMLGGDRQEEDVLVTIMTAEQIVIARSRATEKWVGQQLPPWTGSFEIVGPDRAILHGSDYEEIDRVWGLVELDNGWWVSVGLPAEAVYGPARVAAARQISITLLVLLVGMLIAGG